MKITRKRDLCNLCHYTVERVYFLKVDCCSPVRNAPRKSWSERFVGVRPSEHADKLLLMSLNVSPTFWSVYRNIGNCTLCCCDRFVIFIHLYINIYICIGTYIFHFAVIARWPSTFYNRVLDFVFI